jgi:hypothetical protein
LPGPNCFRTVVAREHDNRVVADVQLIDRVQDLAHVRVDFRERIREVAVTGRAREFRVRQSWKMDKGEWDLGIERFARLRVAFNEVDRSPRDLGVDETAMLHVINLKLAALLALFSFHNVLEGDTRCFCRRF